jgi:hypothetical protein
MPTQRLPAWPCYSTPVANCMPCTRSHRPSSHWRSASSVAAAWTTSCATPSSRLCHQPIPYSKEARAVRGRPHPPQPFPGPRRGPQQPAPARAQPRRQPPAQQQRHLHRKRRHSEAAALRAMAAAAPRGGGSWSGNAASGARVCKTSFSGGGSWWGRLAHRQSGTRRWVGLARGAARKQTAEHPPLSCIAGGCKASTSTSSTPAAEASLA